MTDNSLQGTLQESIRSALGCANTFEGDLHALCSLYGVADGAVSGRIIGVASKHDSTITTSSGALNYLLLNPTVLPTLGVNFVDGTDTLDSRITFTRSSTATRTNSAGTLVTMAANEPRFDYTAAGVARGLLIEEQRTNYARNNTMAGAVAGSPGTRPTNWSSGWTALNSGLQFSISAVGTESGVSYVDVNIAGTSSATTGIGLFWESGVTQIAALLGQSWTTSTYIKVVAGSMGNLVLNHVFSERDAGGVSLITATGSSITPTATLTRDSSARTLTEAATAYLLAGIRFAGDGASTYDVTLRIGMPQMELGAFATSVIPTSTAAATRAADVATMTGANFSSWFNATEGTIYAEYEFLPGSTNGHVFDINDGVNERLYLRYVSTQHQAFAIDGGVSQAQIFDQTGASNLQAKTAYAYKANDFAVRTNGGASATAASADNSGTLPTPTKANIGSSHTGTSGFANGHLKRFAAYQTALPVATLNAVTA